MKWGRMLCMQHEICAERCKVLSEGCRPNEAGNAEQSRNAEWSMNAERSWSRTLFNTSWPSHAERTLWCRTSMDAERSWCRVLLYAEHSIDAERYTISNVSQCRASFQCRTLLIAKTCRLHQTHISSGPSWSESCLMLIIVSSTVVL